MKKIPFTLFTFITLIFALSGTTSAADNLDRRVVFVNNTPYQVKYLYGSSVGRYTWENDILRDRVINPYSQVTINMYDGTGACLFDLKAVLTDGVNYKEMYQTKANVCNSLVWTITAQ